MDYRELLKAYMANVAKMSEAFNAEYAEGIAGGDFLGYRSTANNYLTQEQFDELAAISDELDAVGAYD